MSLAGKQSRIKVGSITSTVFTTEAMALQVGVGSTTYKITDSTKKYFDKNKTITFFDAGTPILESEISRIDWLIGVVVLKNTTVGAITATGSFFTTSTIGWARTFNSDTTADTEDITTFESVKTNSGFRTKEVTLLSVSGSIGGLYDPTESLQNYFFNGATIIIEEIFDIDTSESGKVFEAIIESDNENADVESIVTEDVSFTSTGAVYLQI